MKIDVNNSSSSSCVFRSLVLFFLLSALIVGISSCRAQQSGDGALSEKSDGEFFLLDLVGYNYTNKYIDSYSVDGEGGGNIMVSSPTSGGGGIVCCLKLEKDVTWPIRVRVRWQSAGCTYTSKSHISNSVFENIHFLFKETEVEVRRKVGMNPKYLEVHFYPDGSVEAELTEHFSGPRLVLEKQRADRTAFPRCKDDKKPI